MSAVDGARWNAWNGVAGLLRLGRVVFTAEDDGGWIATARGFEGRGATGVDALAMLCQRAAVRRR